MASRFAWKALFWMAILASIAVVYSVHEWLPIVIHRAASLADDHRPGAQIRPTAESLWRARESAARRRSE